MRLGTLYPRDYNTVVKQAKQEIANGFRPALKYKIPEISDVSGLIQAINSYQIGQKIKVTYWRGNAQDATYATLVERPPPGQ